jgi:hypothetical protein
MRRHSIAGEIYTDRAVGTLRVLNPVTADGAGSFPADHLYGRSADDEHGPVPQSADVPRPRFREAVAKYAEAAKEGVTHAMRDC